eukprot:Pompholyxophrys_sp_v1_NODE_364_length_669_cov_4.416938.p2 type:complete len:135 gc:universal NODE_364_length_669_cov_4.416938:1-405(+)
MKPRTVITINGLPQRIQASKMKELSSSETPRAPLLPPTNVSGGHAGLSTRSSPWCPVSTVPSPPPPSGAPSTTAPSLSNFATHVGCTSSHTKHIDLLTCVTKLLPSPRVFLTKSGTFLHTLRQRLLKMSTWIRK